MGPGTAPPLGALPGCINPCPESKIDVRQSNQIISILSLINLSFAVTKIIISGPVLSSLATPSHQFLISSPASQALALHPPPDRAFTIQVTVCDDCLIRLVSLYGVLNRVARPSKCWWYKCSIAILNVPWNLDVNMVQMNSAPL